MWVYHTAVVTSNTLENPENSPNFAITSSHTPDDHTVKLGWILLNKKLISPPQLEAALTRQHHCCQKLGELLMSEKLISDEQLEQSLREQYWRRNGYWVI